MTAQRDLVFHGAFWRLTLPMSGLRMGKLPADFWARAKPLLPSPARSVRVWAGNSESEDRKPGLFSESQPSLLVVVVVVSRLLSEAGRNALVRA